MNIALNSFDRHVKASELPLDKVSGSSALSSEEKVGEVARQFEAVLLRQILTDAQKPSFGSKKGEGVSTTVYQDMMTNELADQVSRSGGLGLAKSLSLEFTHQLGGTESKPVTNLAGGV